MGKNRAPAIKKPHMAFAKQVKMWVNHASMQMMPNTHPMIISPSCEDVLGAYEGFHPS